MPKIEKKQAMVKDIQEKLDNAKLVVFTDYRGITVEEMTTLRSKLRGSGVDYRVLKNTMTKFALQNLGYEEMLDKLDGPNAVVFSNEDPVGPAKSLIDFIKEYKKLEIKIGILEGQIVPAEKIKDLAELPSREILIAQVLGTMQAPIAGFANVLNANLTGLVRALDQVREQKEAS